MKEFLRKIKENKGITLVELVVAIAILAIASTAIVSFMITGTKSYASSSADINLQYEAQLVLTQIQELMVDATEGVNYWVDDPADESNYRTAEQAGDESATVKGIDILTRTKQDDGSNDDYEVCRIRWYKNFTKDGRDYENAVFYTTYAGDVVEGTDGKKYVQCGAIKSPEEDMLMGEYIDSFKADLSSLADKNSFKLSVHLTNGTGFSKREYATTNNITLRNTLLVNQTSVSGNAIDSSGSEAEVTGLVLSPRKAIVRAGSSVHFSAAVKGTAKVTNFAFSITGNNSSNTTIDQFGNLYVADDETSTSITVDCEPVLDGTKKGSNYADNYKSATVYIKNPTHVDVYTSPSESSIYQNTTFSVYATVTGTNITKSDEDQSVSWSVDEGSEYLSRTGNNTYQVRSNTPTGTKLVIRATSVLDDSVTNTCIIYVKKNEDVQNGDDDGSGSSSDSKTTYITGPDELNRGGAGIYKLSNVDTAGKTITWDVVIKDEDLDEVSGATGTASGTTCTVKVKKTLNYENTYYVYVSCYVIPSGKSKKDVAPYTIKATVNPVAIEYQKTTETTVAYKPNVNATIYYCASAQAKYNYKLIGIEDVTVEFNEYDKTLISLAIDNKKTSSGRLNAGGKSADSTGTTTAYAYINGYRLKDNPVKITVAPGNIYITTTDWSTGTEVTTKKWFYLPLPSEDEFEGDKDKATTNGCWSGKDCPYYTVSPSDNTWYYYYAYIENEDMWYVYIANAVYNNNWPFVDGPFKCKSDGTSWSK